MSTNAEIIELAMSRLGQRKSTKVRADVISEINSSIEELERGTFHPWFLEETATLSIVANDVSKALPTDFLLEAEESRPYYVEEGKTYYLTKRFYAALLAEEPTTLKYYAIRGETLHFRMAADKAYTIYVDYYAKTVDPIVDNSDTVSNPWLINAKDWVVYEALTTVAALHLQNQELGATMSVLAGKAKRDLYIHHEARISENQDFEVGGASDGS